MASLMCHHPPFLLPSRTSSRHSLPSRSLIWLVPRRKPLPRGGSVAASLGPPGFSDFEAAGEWARELVGRAEGFLYTVADAAVNSAPDASTTAGPAVEASKQRDWLSGITDYMEFVLKVLKDGFSALHVPYSYGFAIILLTVLVKAATFPLTKKQVESALAMRSLQPQVKAIQERYAGDQERIQLEIARLYKLAGVNPLAGCLPTLATIPVWIGLYRALSNVANEGLLTEGFFWIPSLAGPTTVAARQSGSGTSWLFPFVDGHPPLGWSDTVAYLVLPVLLVISQFISAQMLQPSQTNDPNQTSSQVVTKLLPLMIGYFALSVPSGLSLYWLTNNILSTAQQIWLQKLGGAKNRVKEFSDKMPRDLQQNVQKPDHDVRSNIVNSGEDVISSSTGLQPGERFKQIKEQEAKRRQEAEETRWRAKEAVEVYHVNDKEYNSDAVHIENKEQDPQGEHVQKRLSSAENGLALNDNNVVEEQSTHEDSQKD
uniref:ALBINO3-like protein 1, chloroplastic n=1 Tax=Anthurium amnicola TaxID=1678845 RepID=A0A1D1YQW7_9ARAE